MERFFGAVFIVAFFAALPAWFLSTQEGWVSIQCERQADGVFECSVHERFAFGSQDTAYKVRSASVKESVRSGRRSTFSEYQLVFDVPDRGRVDVLNHPTGASNLHRIAKEFNAANDSRAPAFSTDLPPDGVFWSAVGILVIFVAAGCFIAWRPGSRAA